MNKDIKEYLHLYFKCWGTVSQSRHEKYINGEWALSGRFLETALMDKLKFTPHLRPLSSMTEEEAKELSGLSGRGGIVEVGTIVIKNNWDDAHYLLSLHFDLFGLIEAGLAIDATKTPTNE